jgi:hypothetical protein
VSPKVVWLRCVADESSFWDSIRPWLLCDGAINDRDGPADAPRASIDAKPPCARGR